MAENKRIVLLRRPRSQGISDDEVGMVAGDCDELSTNQVRVRVIYLSIDPTIRLWLNEAPPVIAPIALGSTVPCMGIGVIEESRDATLPKGTLVIGKLGWQHYCTCPGKEVQPLPAAPGLPLTAHLSLLGATGLTAYFGLLDLGQPQPGEKLLVSGAAGAVGSLVGQIGKIHGCHVTGIAGSDEKCRYLTEQLGFDAALNYRDSLNVNGLDSSDSNELSQQLAAQGGIDLFFDNVGGAIREQGILAMNLGGRIIICGEISSNYKDNRGSGIINSFQIIEKALKLLGIRVDTYFPRAGEAIAQLSAWAQNGQIQHRTHLLEGLENAPNALNLVFNGGNLGKTLVQVSPEPDIK